MIDVAPLDDLLSLFVAFRFLEYQEGDENIYLGGINDSLLGDINQDDLRGRSGLDYCISKLEGIDGVGICRLGYEDIQRNDIIGRVLTALEN